MQRHIWLASYPRSGNTLLRTVLWQCLGLRSASVYPNDLGGNQALSDYVGHVEYGPDRRHHFPAGNPYLLKTHEPPADKNTAIYVVRDGRAACVSLWEFYNRSLPLEDIIRGGHRFGTWSAHLQAWKPWKRPQTLLLRYEDIVDDLLTVLKKLSTVLDTEIKTTQLPARNSIAGADGRWVRKKSDWRQVYTGEQLELFNSVNKVMMKKLDYR